MDNLKSPIYVTKPSLPELQDFFPYLEQIWKTKILTNNGPFHKQLEKELADFLGVPYISLFANGTLALVTALQVFGISGEVITTPYSFVATSHSLLWNNIKPVFVDVEPEFCNLDPEKIEAVITSNTTAIMPVHVYGNPCKVERIEEIAKKYGLKVIYDAAHAFGVDYKGKNICNYGNISILSFHATKVFNTMEGGAIICHKANTKKQIDFLKNFGFAGETTIMACGINSKMNEMQAALGLLQLKNYNTNNEKRREIDHLYRQNLKGIKGISLLAKPENTVSNYAYFPIFVDEKEYGISRDALYEKLKTKGIYGRRYFYPLISEFSMYESYDSANPAKLIHAKKTSQEVICLPIYPDLDSKEVDYIFRCISDFRIHSSV
ncbi:MAG: DegT/DnrJ/EryC1/StrS family aminotransferase [Candidatus Scalindua sp. AMX11]|nr:MAG: DegT/DnrJ/EryC1/StrS family aminotransferase [Candidatus Scalindua sp.]NOG83656.1 DegT/DnrJ/EryC1/StrS family aminotransferase [Planctomycetota bacterium]RZV69967.1 MAG: DegT/DnrJ/EryC1/StrS family aminotransferase [Candidatus Scalindua sp. SCAELEC01]TDE63194.1 MAG: DegT/DnrJ/EryC1/StrS family aminotransferase [Candidatus Scalindua sp. AMX11]GJQ60095.1 MAG: aminotransferase DegT [Candidatus Scalindua sp.]